MAERLKKEIIKERFFPGIFGESLPAEINESPQAIDYYRDASANWADDLAGLVGIEHRNVVILKGEKNGRKGHFVRKEIVYIPAPRF